MNLQFRRSIYSIKDIKKGEKFSSENIRIVRPGFGLQPIYYEKLINRVCYKNLKANTALDHSFLNKK